MHALRYTVKEKHVFRHMDIKSLGVENY